MTRSILSRVAALAAALTALGAPASDEVLLVREACETEVAARPRSAESEALDHMFEECENHRAAASPDEAREAASRLTGSGFCVLGADRFGTSAARTSFCTDPTAEVCRMQSSGNVLDSECRMWVSNARAYSGTHQLQTSRCRIGRDQEAYLESIRSRCPAAMRAGWPARREDCYRNLRGRADVRRELARIEREALYSTPRVQRVQNIWDRMKTQYLALIDAADPAVIPDAHKAHLRRRLQATTLAMDPADMNAPLHRECHQLQPPPVEASTGAYSHRPDWSSVTTKVHVCAGMMENLDQMNPYQMMEVLAHELSHSIDPCTLEQDALFRTGTRAPRQGERAFPGLMECLRGGPKTSADGCASLPLRCSTPGSARRHCAVNTGPGQAYDNVGTCLSEMAAVPDCPMGEHDHGETDGDYSDYRGAGGRTGRGGHAFDPMDQMQEGFADFMAGEVMGRIIDEDTRSDTGPLGRALTDQDRRDILISVTSSNTRLHGVCLTANTLDAHPPGFVRTDRLIMGSRAFREAVGCGTAVPVRAPTGPYNGPPPAPGTDPRACRGF